MLCPPIGGKPCESGCSDTDSMNSVAMSAMRVQRLSCNGANPMRSMVCLAACLSLCAVAYAGNADSTNPVPDNAKPDATVTLSGGSFAAGIGYTWGHGKLKTSDQSQKFSIK